jgi:type II secretory pathway component PulF
MAFNYADIEQAYARFIFKTGIPILSDSTAQRRRLWLKLSKMMKNGMKLMQAITVIRDRRIAAGGKSHPMTLALDAWATGLRNGKRLSAAMEGWVGEQEMMLIAAGEQSGDVPGALIATARTMQAKRAIKKTISRGLAYPSFLLLLAFAVLYLFGFKIVPAFTNAIPGSQWTGLALAMIKVSNFAQNWLWLLALSTVSIIVVFFISLPRFDGTIRIKLDRIAPYSIYRVIQGSSWLIAIASLVTAGLSNITALEQLSEIASPWLRTRMQSCLAVMRSGLNMGDALARTGYEFPDREIIDDLQVYAALSGFNEALEMLGEEWLTESVEQIEARMSIVFGIAILSVGFLIAFMVGGMMQMQLQLGEIMQHAVR